MDIASTSFLKVGGLKVNEVNLPKPREECESGDRTSPFRRRGSGFLRGVPAGLVIGFG
jgi:hypothetical protein